MILAIGWDLRISLYSHFAAHLLAREQQIALRRSHQDQLSRSKGISRPFWNSPRRPNIPDFFWVVYVGVLATDSWTDWGETVWGNPGSKWCCDDTSEPHVGAVAAFSANFQGGSVQFATLTPLVALSSCCGCGTVWLVSVSVQWACGCCFCWLADAEAAANAPACCNGKVPAGRINWPPGSIRGAFGVKPHTCVTF